jgi:HPt (histidine-containing phosphotransfer) domain-containing protein
MLEKHLTFVHQHSDNSTFKSCEALPDLNFDQQMLKESIGHNQVILGEILEAVQIQFDKDLASLGNAISEKNLAEIKKAAHSIKGASLNMRFNRMAELSKKIELFLDQDHFKELEKIFSEVILEWKQLQVLLKKMKF